MVQFESPNAQDHEGTAHTSSPVQNMGHLFHGFSLTSPSHALRYGFRTIRGRTGGVSLEASAKRPRSTEPAAAAMKKKRIVTTILQPGKDGDGQDFESKSRVRLVVKRGEARVMLVDRSGG